MRCPLFQFLSLFVNKRPPLLRWLTKQWEVGRDRIHKSIDPPNLDNQRRHHHEVTASNHIHLLGQQPGQQCLGSSNVNDAHDDKMSRVFVQYSGHKDEVANTLGIATEVHYDFKKLETFVGSVPSASLELLRNDPNILRVEESRNLPQAVAL
jgi:hypothetical protein